MSAELHALVGPYVLDALDDEERRRFEDHLERCGTCRTEVAELAGVTEHLAGSVAEPVPDRMRAEVLASVERTRQVTPIVDRASGRRFRRAAAVAAAAAVLLVAVWGASSWRGALQRADRAEQLVAIASAADTRSVEMEGDLDGLRALVSPGRRELVVLGSGVPGPADDRTYQLWFVGSDGPEPAGTFVPGDDGQVRLVVEGVPQEQLAVTEEPGGGSPAPTGPILAAGAL